MTVVWRRTRPLTVPAVWPNRAVLLLILSALLWSLGGVLIKSIEWNPLAIAGSRSLIAVLAGWLFIGLASALSFKGLDKLLQAF